MTDTIDPFKSALADRYLVERELGRGGMATVYLARDLRHERMVAVKVLDPSLSVSLGTDRFLREIRLAAGLQHPHILGVYDSGEAAGLMYFVMPFVEGESLRDKLNREVQLQIEEAVQITLEVADALAFAHSRGIVHRDIKPENILLSGGHAVVADFGIARAVSEAGDKLTQTGMAIGTPAYMSPEQAVGESSVDGRSDVYSLACVTYEMLSGRPPFNGPSARAIMAQHSMEIVPSLQILRQSIPDELEDAILRALEKVPADRFPTASQFAKALSGSSTSVTAAHLTRRRTTTKQVYKSLTLSKKYRWIAAGAIPLVIAIGWFVATRSGNAAGAAADPRVSRIAVMYFEDRSGGTLRHVADGFTDALIHDLSTIPSLKVVSRNGVLPYRGQPLAPDSISRALDVGTMVDGTVEDAGGNVKVTVTLINALTGDEIASKTLERPRADLLVLQKDLTTEVSVFLRQRLGQELTLSQRRSETGTVEAWETYQRAQEQLNDVDALVDAGDVGAALRRLSAADSLLARSEDQDRDWVRPIVTRGWVAYRQARTGDWSRDTMQIWLNRSAAHADRALEKQAGNSEALELSGTVRYFMWLLSVEPDQARRDALLAKAQADLRSSVEGDATRAMAWSSLSHMLISQSENAEGKLAALKAYEADPYLTSVNLIIWRIFIGSFELNDPVESRHWCAEGLRRFPEDYRFQECQLMELVFKATRDDIDSAWVRQRRMAELTPENLRPYFDREGRMLIAAGLARAGLPDSARAVALAARAGTEIDETRDLAMFEAMARAILGDRDETIRLLGQYLAVNPARREYMAKDPGWYFADVSQDPRFRLMVGGNTSGR
jgi:TolB-like protein/predicted RNase H-related nuclease YkuK (DUF458 family)